jgi:hypothetical protein
MIDKRLERLNPWIVQDENRVAVGRQVASEFWAQAVQTALAGYLKELLVHLAAATQSEDDSSAVVAFCDRLPVTSLVLFNAATPWPATILAELDMSLRQPNDHPHPRADWLIGAALFDALAARQQPADGSNVAKLLAPNVTRVFSFAERARSANDGELDGVLSAMRQFIRDECANPHAHLMPGRTEALAPAVARWSAETDFGAVWDTRTWMGLEMLPERLHILTAIAAAKPTEFLSLIEEIRILPLIQGTLQWRSVILDFDKVLDLLLKAPPVLEPQSGLWNRNVVAALLLEFAFDQLTQLGTYRQDDGTPLAEAAELATLAQSIISRTLERPDGVALAERWMRHQIWLAETRADNESFAAVFNASLSALAGTQLQVGDVYPRLTSQVPVTGTFSPQLSDHEGNQAFRRLVLAVMLEQERVGSGRGQPNADLHPSFLALLREARNAFGPRYGEPIPSWRHYPFTELYWDEAEPAKLWREDFDMFALERRASAHYSYSDDNSLAAPGLFLAGVGLSLIDRCSTAAQGSPMREHALALWRQIFDATRQHFTHWSISNDNWRKVAGALFARFPGCVTVQQSESENANGLQWLEQLGMDEALFATALANLLANGMNLSSIARGSPEQQQALTRRVSDYLAWEGGAGSRTLNPGLVKFLAGSMNLQLATRK